MKRIRFLQSILKNKVRWLVTIASLVCLIGVVGYFTEQSQAAQPSIQLTTDPPIAQIIPFKQPVQLKLTALDAQGNPFKNVHFQLHLLTPPKTPWFTTDFPIVEGTDLLQLDAMSPDGQLDVQQVFPVRGNYQLHVTAAPLVDQAFAPIQQTLTIPIPENPVKYRNLLVLTGFLLLIGWMGGRVIGRRHPLQPGEIAPQPARLLLSGAIGVAIVALLMVNVSAELTESHHHTESAASSHKHESVDHHKYDHDAHGLDPSLLRSLNLKLDLIADKTATVGELASLSLQALDAKTTQPVTDLLLKIKTTQLEDNELTFAYQNTMDAVGKLAWKQQFFDGAPHQVEVEVSPQPGSSRQFQPFTLSHVVEVEAVAPPLSTRFISLTYFVSLIVIGLIYGLWQQRLKRQF